MVPYSKLVLQADEANFDLEDEVLTFSPENTNNLQEGSTKNKLIGDLPGRDNLNSKRIRDELPIYHAAISNGRRIPLVKTLLTTVCEKNCFYCFSRADRDCQRYTFKPEELAKIYMQIYQSGVARGIFLSSGVVGGGIQTQDCLIATAEILRVHHGYKGYMHLKIMPGAERAQVERAMHLSDRVSINLEAPTTHLLTLLAPEKTKLEELILPLKWVNEIRQQSPINKGWNDQWPSSTTQFVVGAGDELDFELLRMTEYLYDQLKLARTYYSGFKPIYGTPLEKNPPVNLWRKYRLYQASYLLKTYPFTLEDIPLSSEGFLNLDVDPKMAWAKNNLSEAPMEINHVDLRDLMKIPGIGMHGAHAIIALRRTGLIKNVEHSRKQEFTLPGQPRLF